MLDYGIKPIMVFDGKPLEINSGVKLKRKRYAFMNLFFSLSFLRFFKGADWIDYVFLPRDNERNRKLAEKLWLEGDRKAAENFYRKSIECTPQMVLNVIRVKWKKNEI